MRKNILLTVSLLTLVGCGGGGASVTPKVLEILTTTVTEIVFGETRVIDGYVSGAEVFIDYNWNLVRDEGEPLATEDTTNNIYSFNLSLIHI